MSIKPCLSPVANGNRGTQSRGSIAEPSVKEAAYFIWEKEGRPLGHELDHWLRAEKEVRRLVDTGKIRKQPW
ncbi:MAG: DUF2934 domain-containing protein [Isosphaeraceae bacterium]